MSLRAVSDEFLAARAARGDGAAFAELARRYRWLLVVVSKHPPAAVTFEDLYQEALLGLFHACRVQRTEIRGHFKGLVGLSVRWRVRKARRAAVAVKHRVLSDAVRETDEPQLWDAQPSRALAGGNPALLVEVREELRKRADPMRRRGTAPGGDLGRRYSDLQITRALALMAEGKTPKQAAWEVGATADRVKAWATKAGQRHSGHHRYSQQEIEHALALLKAGASLRRAGAAGGAPAATVREGRRKAACPTPPPPPRLSRRRCSTRSPPASPGRTSTAS